ncbi:hypothetical protein P3T37_004334 [Kitasatospora sp. MAA4]|uniref:hypothetical protein n=1 Tax=Kitasatospora sp. MAA4 TaxID=3035093 RepID=UPI00247392DA|nr:hypothetical protein [Kitasatospora sp. MAA4]MDH6134925.1 hypothetical protein [Kitasatospora sp. MAA4]
MREDPYDLWHVTDVEKYAAKLKAKGRLLPEPCGCKPAGQIPTADHGKAKRWRAEWRDANGKQRYRTFAPNRKTAARNFQRSQRAAVSEGRDPVPAQGSARSGVPTVAECVAQYLSEHERREGTVEAYESRLRVHVVPAFGGRPVNSVTRAEYKTWFSELKKSGMPDTTRSGVRKALSAMLSWAVENDGCRMSGHPVKGIRLSQETRARETARLTWAHVVVLAEEIDGRYEFMFWQGALQALRSMEAAGVRDQDMTCDADGGLQAVEKQQRRRKDAPLKTRSSRTVLDVGSFLARKYLTHCARYRRPLSDVEVRRRERRGLAPIRPEYAELVTLTRYWTPVQENSLCRAFDKAKERARARGVDVPEQATFRDLRHFVDAVLMASGLEPRKVQAADAARADGRDCQHIRWHVDWENAPASFTELYGIEAPAGLPEAALWPAAERERRRSEAASLLESSRRSR